MANGLVLDELAYTMRSGRIGRAVRNREFVSGSFSFVNGFDGCFKSPARV